MKKNITKLITRFIFLNSGFNLRPTEIQAAIARNQFKRLNTIKKVKKSNHKKIINYLKKQ